MCLIWLCNNSHQVNVAELKDSKSILEQEQIVH